MSLVSDGGVCNITDFAITKVTTSGSTDGNNWTTVSDLIGQDGGDDIVTFTATNARYVRMQGVTRALTYGYSIWEMNVYGK